jgi:hypothetical protein
METGESQKAAALKRTKFSTHWQRPSKGKEIKEMHHLQHALASRQASYSSVRLRFADSSPAAMWDPAGSTPRHLYLTYKDRFARWIALSKHRGRGHVSPIFLSVGGTERTDVCTRVILLSLFRLLFVFILTLLSAVSVYRRLEFTSLGHFNFPLPLGYPACRTGSR